MNETSENNVTKSSKDIESIFNELDSRLDNMEQTIFRVIYAITENN
jgi:hypothetical protein